MPHLRLALSGSMDDQVVDMLTLVCRSLLGRPDSEVLVDDRTNVITIPVMPERVERVRYKTYLRHNETGNRYPCMFASGSTLGQCDDESILTLTMTLPGAKFVWLKSQARINDHIRALERFISVEWHTITGAAHCKIHMHYSSTVAGMGAVAEGLAKSLREEADLLYVCTFPIHVSPRQRAKLGTNAEFRNVAYSRGVSLWTRTLRSAPVGNEWCTLATDDVTQLNAACYDYTIALMGFDETRGANVVGGGSTPPPGIHATPIDITAAYAAATASSSNSS